MNRSAKNLYTLRPERTVRWETTPEGLAVLIVPRFRARLLARFLLPRLKRPEFRVRLDALGTSVWERCDGVSTVLEIAASVHTRFGGDRDGIDERVSAFVVQLERDGYVKMQEGGTLPPG